ncbi:GGDEF domain-containing protein [Luteimonas aestuarii]|uniref:diguanylate cyclase n=1 Tax=Luteimonas aestuarii TaxID=453837 RepID=A0A4R5TR15_9GAMM|nr:diguanylate cyclase [Luteimonas aestuarii]TDK21728.1 GGDEF domain-containing protein [Luteimonas aestuarii]
MAVLLSLFAAVVTGAVPHAGDDLGVAVGGMGAEDGMPAWQERNVVQLPGGHRRETTVWLRFSLPPVATDESRWVLRLPRDPVDGIELRRDGWRSTRYGFYTPQRVEGLLPGGYVFPLPLAWQGETQLVMQVDSSLRGAFTPKLMRESDAMRIEQYGAATAAMVYASLFTLALLALALFSAARDRMFLVFFGFSLLALVTLAGVNGHLYQLPGLRLFAAWGAMGLCALAFLFGAGWLQVLVRYVGLQATHPSARRAIDGYCLVLVGGAALCLLNVELLVPWTQPFASAALAVVGVLGVLMLVDAGLRRVPMAWPLAVLSLATGIGALLMELSARGQVPELLLVRYGYQLGLVVSIAILAVGLIGRISEYRYQRDREQLARADTERRMEREASRSNLAAELQTELRALPVGDVEWTAFRLLLDHLSRLMPLESASAVVRGYHGQDLLLVEPLEAKQPIQQSIEKRLLALKRQCANGLPLQQPVTAEGVRASLGIEALLPLPIRAPAWGGLLLRRKGGDGFTTEELSLAGELARLTLLQIDQAVAAIQLRRSAEVDALTGSFNRRTIDQWMTRAFDDAQRDGQPVSVLFIDLDHFKSVNDRYGHACGDFCLRNVASTLRAALPEGDLFGRYGGEEFIAVLPGRGGAAARVIGEQLRVAVENMQLDWSGQALPLTVSVGVATRRDNEDTPAATLDRADKALYAAKRNGRNCVQVAPAVFS